MFEPLTIEQNMAVVNYVKDNLGQRWQWIGIDDRSSEGDYRYSSNNNPVSFTNWRPGHPDNKGNEDCVALAAYHSSTYYGIWEDWPCMGKTTQFACEFVHRGRWVVKK